MHTAADRADLPATIDAHLQFHRMFYEHSGHRLLKTMWTGWESKLRLFLAADHRCYDDLHQLAIAHEELLALVFSGEKDLFRRALAHHVHVAPGAAIDEYRTSLPCLVGLALVEEG
jgi:DNA-binding GntR family transcriptional regulator